VTRKAKKTVGMRRAAAAKTSMEKSSGNVFADLGVLHPEQELLKAKLTLQIYGLEQEGGLGEFSFALGVDALDLARRLSPGGAG